jgi:group II intron reverse transcriptase/maturase
MNNVEAERTHLNKLAAANPQKRFRKLYRLISNRTWLEAALAAIRSNKGFNTPGVDGLKGEDLDAEWLDKLVEQLRNGTYQPSPVQRVFIPKRNGKLRPLGKPTAADKVVQSAIKLVLEPIYEQTFCACSHGFRPKRSCHTALRDCLLQRTPTWTIEGDLKSFFDKIDHGVLLTLLRKKIADERLIELIRQFLKAGYLQDWQWHATWSGTPQGGVLSPLLANVVLHEFDVFVEDILGANKGLERGYAGRNPAYNRINLKVNRRSHRLAKETDLEKRAELLAEIQQLKRERERLPSMLPVQRLTYQRYADDWTLALHGYSKQEARTLKDEIAQWLKTQLKLTLNLEKTVITHWTDRVRFLGYDIRGIKSDTNGVSRAPRLIIPHDAEQRVRHKIAKLTRQTSIEPGDMFQAVNAVLRGWMNYYCYASNPHRVFARTLHYAFWRLVRYLNKRHKRRGAKKVMLKYYDTVNGRKTLVIKSSSTGRQIALVRSIGRKSLYKLDKTSADVDRCPIPWTLYSAAIGRSPWQREETKAIQNDQCAQCGASVAAVHHHTGLAKKTNPTQAGYETKKTGLCHACHRIRTRQQRGQGQRGKPDTVKAVCPV